MEVLKLEHAIRHTPRYVKVPRGTVASTVVGTSAVSGGCPSQLSHKFCQCQRKVSSKETVSEGYRLKKLVTCEENLIPLAVGNHS